MLALWAALASAGCDGAVASEDRGVSTPDAGPPEPTLAVVLGDSERGTSDGVGEAARFQGVTAMCALTPHRIALSDTFGGTLRVLDLETAEVRTIAGRADEPGVVDGSLEEARFAGPRGLGCFPGGTALLVADDGALRLVDLEAGRVTTMAGRPGAPGYEDGSAARARIGYLIHAIRITPDGSTAVLTDRSNGAIRAVDLATYAVRTLSGPDAGWRSPGGLAFDPAEPRPTRVYVAELSAGRVRWLELAGGALGEVGSVMAPQGVVLHDGALLAMGFGATITRIELATGASSVFYGRFGGTFASPLAIDGGLVYPELERGSVRRLALDTLEDRLVAGSEQPSGNVDGDARAARFEQITDLVASRDGRLVLIADAGNGALRRARFEPGGAGRVDTLPIAGLRTPVGLALSDDARRLAVTDYGAGAVLELELDASGEVVSQRSRARGLAGPHGVAWGLDGALFVAEAEAARVLRIAPDDELTVHAGSGDAGALDGPALEASFVAPAGVVATAEGLLILDDEGAALRWSDFSTGRVVTLTGGADGGEARDGTLASATWGEPVRAAPVGTGAWLVVDREAGILRHVAAGEPGLVRTVAGSPLRRGGLPTGAVVPLSRAALGGASALARVEGAWLVATATAVHRLEGDALARP